MGLKRPGTRSNATLLVSGSVAVLLLIILIGGHMVLAYLVFSSFFGHHNMASVSTNTGLPGWALWLMVMGAIVLDGYIYHSVRLARKRARER